MAPLSKSRNDTKERKKGKETPVPSTSYNNMLLLVHHPLL